MTGRPRPLWDWKNAKSSGLDGSAMMRSTGGQHFVRQDFHRVGNALLDKFGRQGDLVQLRRYLPCRSETDDQRVAGQIDNGIDEDRPLRCGRGLAWLRPALQRAGRSRPVPDSDIDSCRHDQEETCGKAERNATAQHLLPPFPRCFPLSAETVIDLVHRG